MPSIAVIGASADRRKFGNRCVRAYQQRGYTVYPVHPTETTIEGLPAYPSIVAVPAERLDLVSIYLPPAIGLKVLDEIAQKSIGEVLLNPGADDPTVVARGKALGLNVICGCSIVMLGMHPDQV